MSRTNPSSSIARMWELRTAERSLLGWCLLCISVGFLMLWGSNAAGPGRIAWQDLLPLGLYALSLLTMHLLFVFANFRGDQILVVAVSFLSGFGMLAQYRMGSFETQETISRNLVLFPIGFLLITGLAISLMRGRYRVLAQGNWIWIWPAVSLGLLFLLFAFGQRFRGGVYSVGLLTPSELLKVTIVLFLAGYVDRQSKTLSDWGRRFPVPPWRTLLPLAVFWLVLATLLVVQRDLGLLVVLSVALLVILFVGTGRYGYLLLGALGAVGSVALVKLLAPHGARRIGAWLDPFQDPTGGSWQILQGLSGMYSGGLWGEGFGRGNPEYTPIAQSDFIYTVIGEELGFAGGVIVVVFFLILFGRGFVLSSRSGCSYGQLVGVGMITILATQTFLNLAGVTNFLPLTGIPLPFISHGGSSLLTGFVAVGLLLAISDGGAPPTTQRQPTPTNLSRQSRVARRINK